MIIETLVLEKVDKKYCGLWIRKQKAQSNFTSFSGLKLVESPCEANNENARPPLRQMSWM